MAANLRSLGLSRKLFLSIYRDMDHQHLIFALAGLAAGIVLCQVLKKERFTDMWDEEGIASPVDNLTGTLPPDQGPDFSPTVPVPTTYPPGSAQFLLMDNAFDMSTATPLNPIPPYA